MENLGSFRAALTTAAFAATLTTFTTHTTALPPSATHTATFTATTMARLDQSHTADDWKNLLCDATDVHITCCTHSELAKWQRCPRTLPPISAGCSQ